MTSKKFKTIDEYISTPVTLVKKIIKYRLNENKNKANSKPHRT